LGADCTVRRNSRSNADSRSGYAFDAYGHRVYQEPFESDATAGILAAPPHRKNHGHEIEAAFPNLPQCTLSVLKDFLSMPEQHVKRRPTNRLI